MIGEKDKLILEALSYLLSRGFYDDDRIKLAMKINDFVVDNTNHKGLEQSNETEEQK